MASNLSATYNKWKRKTVGIFYIAIKNTPFQFWCFRSYWNHRLFNNRKIELASAAGTSHYLAQRPNYSAGIGHQLSNWNTGYYFSRHFNLGFAHFPFATERWEYLLGMGENEVPASRLLKDKTFKKVRLPQFNSANEWEIKLVGKIIQSYKHSKVLFLMALDQDYMRQCETYIDLSKKFFLASARKEDKLFYKSPAFNIAVHIRRGDLAGMKANNDSRWPGRWLNNDYYVQVINNILRTPGCPANAHIFLFSQGREEDFHEFSQLKNVHYCMTIGEHESFVHLAFANIIISSKSSFSYKPALMSKGIKICPANFWHQYPASPDFILADEDGNFDNLQLQNALTTIDVKTRTQPVDR